MSSPDRSRAAPTLRSALAAMLLLSAGCTVRPLYATAPSATGSIAASSLNAIAIAPVETRYGQELRNRLIFLLDGGAGQPAAAAYAMTLFATVLVTNEATVKVDDEDRPTAATLQMTGSYVLTDAGTGKAVAQGTRQITASYDQPTQEFANLRARRDAEDRAARELAELLKLDIAQRLARIEAAPAKAS